MNTSFIFTSGRRSSHHEHTGYGLKEGLEGEPYDIVELLERPCLELCQGRRERRGLLLAVIDDEVRWSGELEITSGYEPSGRPNFMVRGTSPPVDLLHEGILRGLRWRFQEANSEVSVIDLGGENTHLGKRMRMTRLLLILITMIILCLLVYFSFIKSATPSGYMLK